MLQMPSLGWLADQPDHRDYCAIDLLGATLPTERPHVVDMSPGMPSKYNQGRYGSCVSQQIRRAVQYTGGEVGGDTDLPSSFYIYTLGRLLSGYSIRQDTGLTVRNGLKTVVKYGYCDERTWPSTARNFARKPSRTAMNEGAKKRLKNAMYARVPQNIDDLRDVLAAGNPIVFGFTVYSSFDRVGKSGIVPYPEKNERARGGHAMCIVGYDDAMECFKVHNSWGSDWGDEGACYMSYDHLTNPQLASDFWTIVDVPHLHAKLRK